MVGVYIQLFHSKHYEYAFHFKRQWNPPPGFRLLVESSLVSSTASYYTMSPSINYCSATRTLNSMDTHPQMCSSVCVSTHNVPLLASSSRFRSKDLYIVNARSHNSSPPLQSRVCRKAFLLRRKLRSS